MSDFMDRARVVQLGVVRTELENIHSGIDDYSDAQVGQATVHTRQDLVMVVILLKELNEQVRWLKRIAFVGLLTLVGVCIMLLQRA